MTPLFPEYEIARAILAFLDGKSKKQYLHMMKAIWELTGTPQNTVDWKDPSEWIPGRLTGEAKDMAIDLWQETNQLVNPRHVRGSNFLLKRYDLLDEVNDRYIITERGKDFVNHQFGKVETEIDEGEGVFKLLKIIYFNWKGKSADFYDDWQNYLLAKTNYSKKTAIYSLLRYRLANMISRSLIKRSANKYQITKKGFKYLERNTSPNELVQEKKEKEEEDLLIDRGKEFTTNQRSLLKEKLHQMDPFAFEELVKFLMEAMGYEDVEVTPKSRDKGVDVIGTIENGISSVKEVIQVKRFRKNINRDIVSQLRGDVPLFEAYRGTIITTSDFTKDAKESALDSRGVPITLINGDKLMDLLIRHKIGIIPKTIQYFLVDESTFNTDIEPT